MALAIRFDRLLRDGVVADQAELARLGHVSRTGITQIMNLLNFAPDIQEDHLFLAPISTGRGIPTERHVRAISGRATWSEQHQQRRAKLAGPNGR